MSIKQNHLLLVKLLLTASLLVQAHAHSANHIKYSKELRFQSEGSWLPALYYGAAGPGPHPTVILLHGYPGNEKNLDIAQGLRAYGYNVLFFHYRGAWGAEGAFGFLNAEADVQAAIAFLSDSDRARDLNINIGRISLVGHSMGGHMALAGLQQNKTIRCAVAYDTANIGVTFSAADADRAASWIAYGDSLFMLRGWSGEKSKQEVESNQAQLDLRNHVAAIGSRPVLLIAADSDVIPLTRIERLADAMRKANVPVTYQLLADDHSFNNHRDELLASTRDFLNRECQ